MLYTKLELQIAQVERLIANSRSKFPNEKKEHIYNNMLLLFDRIKISNYAKFKPPQLTIVQSALQIIFYTIEYLDYKNESEIPKRLIFCLNKVLNDWIDDGDNNYFIVVSYNKTQSDFFLKAFEQSQLILLKQYIKLLFNIEYTQSLIQISKPKYLFNDHLSSVPVYHELGHFIDKNYQIVYNFSREDGFANHNISEIHFSEFFADLFAAQYIGKSAVAPLDETKTVATKNHPSNSKRVEVVNTFIEGTGPIDCMRIVTELKRITFLRTNKELKIRYELLSDDENPFISLTPKVINNYQKLHSLFNVGWQNWLDTESLIRKRYPLSSECSTIINRLIHQSIRLTMQQGELRRLKRIGNRIENIASRFGYNAN